MEEDNPDLRAALQRLDQELEVREQASCAIIIINRDCLY